MEIPDGYEKIAEQSMTRPSDAAFWGEGMYDTHGPAYFWADRGDDLIDESNYYAFLEEMNSLHPENDDDSDWFTAGLSDWAVGHLESIWVRWYWPNGEPTEAGLKAYELLRFLIDDGPFLDEYDYLERESEAWDKEFADTFVWWLRHYEESADREFNDTDTNIISDRLREQMLDCGEDASVDPEWLAEIIDDFLYEVWVSAVENERVEEDAQYDSLIGEENG